MDETKSPVPTKVKPRTRQEMRAEKTAMWEEIRKKNESRKAKSIVKREKPSIRYDENGKPLMMQPWGQEGPAGSGEAYFWELLQDTRKSLTPEFVEKYCKERKSTDDETDISVLKDFVKIVTCLAEESVEKRNAKREEDIRSVRRDTGFYEDEGTTEEEFEDNDE